MKPGHWALAVCLACWFSGCAVLSSGGTDDAIYDFGPARPGYSGGATNQSILVYDVGAPAWMDTPSIHYRLAYLDAARPRMYAHSRWVMPPAGLLSVRLRQRISGMTRGGIVIPADGVRANFALRVGLEEFGQVFDAAARSRGVVRLRATLIGNQGLVGQRVIEVEQPASSPDAEGGVRALTRAADEAIDRTVDWVASQIGN